MMILTAIGVWMLIIGGGLLVQGIVVSHIAPVLAIGGAILILVGLFK